MKTLHNLLPVIFFFNCLSATAQNGRAEDLSMEEIETLMKTEERFIVMQFSTDWCVYCKMQERQLNKNEEIIRWLSEKTYYIHINAESKDTILFNQILYKPSPYKNGLHDFTLALTGKNEQPSFPLWVIFNKNKEIFFRKKGLIKPKELAEVLKKLPR